MRCNVSSWFVDPAYRMHAAPLVSAALRFKNVTYLNVSPAPNTWPILEAQGYRRYVEGQFAALPALSLSGLGATVRLYEPAHDDARLPPEEVRLLQDHAACGCLVLVCARGDDFVPLVFLRRDIKHIGKVAMQLAYCRDTQDFARYAGPVGRFPGAARGRAGAMRRRRADPGHDGTLFSKIERRNISRAPIARA